MAPTAPQTKSLLLAVPMELLQRITANLEHDGDAILNTRLTCKTLEGATFDLFADKFFSAHQYCILYKHSLLRLQALLACNSRLMPRMRRLILTSYFFVNTTYKQVKLALQENEVGFLEDAQSSAVNTWSLARVETLLREQALLPDADLIRTVLIALKSKLPDAEIDLDVEHNIRSCISVHANVLVAVASLGIRIAHFSVHSSILGKLEMLLPELLACTSSMVGFSFSNSVLGADGSSEDENELPTSATYDMLRTLLASADNLRKLSLAFNGSRPGNSLQLMSELLVASLHPRLHTLELCCVDVPGATLLKAFSSWSGRLEKVRLAGVYLSNVGGGWEDVLRTLTTMPRLCEISLYGLYSRIGIPSALLFVDLRQLKHGQVTACQERDNRMLKKISFRDKDEVAAGLQELLGGDGGLKYH